MRYEGRDPRDINQAKSEAEIIPINRQSTIEDNYEWASSKDSDADGKDFEDEENFEDEEDAIEIPEKLHCLDLADEDKTQHIEDEKERQEKAANIRNLEDNIKSLKAGNNSNSSDSQLSIPNINIPEPTYDWIESKFLNRMEKLCTIDDTELKFRYPDRYWNSMDTVSVVWVNIRLRCLLENLIRASNYNSISRESFALLSDAFVSLVKSPTYKSLPKNYPYTNMVTELAVKMNRMNNSNVASEIKIQLPAKKKAMFIVMRRQLLNNTHPIKFEHLHYQDPRDYYASSNREKPEGEEEMKEKNKSEMKEVKGWQKRAAEAIKQDNLKKAS